MQIEDNVEKYLPVIFFVGKCFETEALSMEELITYTDIN